MASSSAESTVDAGTGPYRGILNGGVFAPLGYGFGVNAVASSSCLVRGIIHVNFLIMAVEFGAGLFEDKLPIDGRLPGVALRHTGVNMSSEFVLGGDALVQALAGDGRELDLDHVESGGTFGRVVHLEACVQGVGLGGGQVLVKDGVGVGVTVVLDQHGFLGLGVVSS